MSQIIFSMKVKVAQSCQTLQPHGLYSPWNSPGQNTGVEGIFPTQGWNPGLPLCRCILYQLSHKGSQRILEWVAYPFSSVDLPELNGGLLHCRQILYQLTYEGNPLYPYRCVKKKKAKRNILYSNQVVLNWGQFCSPPPQGTFDNSWRCFWLSQREAWVLLASSGQRPGMLPNMTQCTG